MSTFELTKWNYEVHSTHVTYWRLTSIENDLGHHAQNVHIEENSTGPGVKVTLSIPYSTSMHESDVMKDDDLTCSHNQTPSDEINKHEGDVRIFVTTFFYVEKVDYFKSAIKDVELDKCNTKCIHAHCRDPVKISQSLKLRGEHLKNNGDHEKAITYLFSTSK